MAWEELIEIKKEYYNGLDIHSFCRCFGNTTACYKMYWFDAILTILTKIQAAPYRIPFDEIFDEMVFQGWYSRAYYRLKFGNRVGGCDRLDAIEESIDLLVSLGKIKSNSDANIVKKFILESRELLHDNYKRLKKYVPIRFLNPFLGNSNNSYKEMIPLINAKYLRGEVPYRIIDGDSGLAIEVHENWAVFFKKEYFLLKKWIEYEKCYYLQKYNQEVPGIINKLDLNTAERDLTKLRNLWTDIFEIDEITDIFSETSVDRDNYALDHFIPWSYIANNELWNIIPIHPSVNSMKSDNLPDWKYAETFCRGQYVLYKHLNIYKTQKIIKDFNLCRNKHLCAEWAGLLFEKDVDERSFVKEIMDHLIPYYKSAQNLGYTIWNYK